MPQLSFHSPVGDLTLSEEDGAIVSLDWGWAGEWPASSGAGRTADTPRGHPPTALLREARDQLNEYFDGLRTQFDITLAPRGTPYRKRIWSALCQIPPGETCTYADLARSAGGSPRSVGGAMATNPIPILIPCHRVVATSGPGGYSGGDGLPTKAFLLALERRGRHLPSTEQALLEFP